MDDPINTAQSATRALAEAGPWVAAFLLTLAVIALARVVMVLYRENQDLHARHARAYANVARAKGLLPGGDGGDP